MRSRGAADVASALDTRRRLDQALAVNEADQRSLQAQVAAAQGRIDQLDREIRALDQRIAAAGARVARQQEEVAALARALYRHQDSLIEEMAKQKSVEASLRSAADLLIAAGRAHELEVKVRATRDGIAAERAARARDRTEQTRLRVDLRAKIAALDSARKRIAALEKQLQQVVDGLREAIARIPEQPPEVVTALLRVLESQEATLSAASYLDAWSQASVGAGTVLLAGGVRSAGITASELRLSVPLPGATITQAFGPTDLSLEPPYSGYDHFHTGIDFAAPTGTPVLAAASGVVVAVGSGSGGYGNYVILEHGTAVLTLYGHLDSALVQPGDVVGAMQPVGWEGSTGVSTGPHLHFELRVGGEPVDPAPYFVTPI